MGMMLNRRRAYGGKKSLLPSGYKQLEYIENTSNAYIDTGIIPSVNKRTKIYGETASLRSYDRSVFGSNFNLNIDSNNTWSGTVQVILGEFVSFILQQTKSGRYIEVNKISTYKSNNERQNPFYLFVLNDVSNTQIFNAYKYYGRFKEVYIEENDILIRHYVPCINPNNVVGMYDTVNGVFYSSPNGTAFIAGPEV